MHNYTILHYKCNCMADNTYATEAVLAHGRNIDGDDGGDDDDDHDDDDDYNDGNDDERIIAVLWINR